jgi:hypothetical protein
MKYWSVVGDRKRLLVQPGRVPWVALLVTEVLLGGITFAILWPVWRYAPEDRWLFVLMCFPAGLAVLGCFILPVHKILAERAKGAIFAYDREREMLSLPRERLSLTKAQLLEFRILQEYVQPRESGEWTFSLLPKSWTRGNTGAAELQVIYRNPNQKSLTLLRACGSRRFDDVVRALKAAGPARIVLAEQQASRSDWKVSEV